LLKYFGEVSDFPYEIDNIHLIASCIKCGNFTPPSNYTILERLGSRVHIWHAEDDSVVPVSVGQEIAESLPKAETHFFTPER
jgi:pimeloyl-ACP methyl ester carboxylesterase